MIEFTSKIKIDYKGISFNSYTGEITLYRNGEVLTSFKPKNFQIGDTINLTDLEGTFQLEVSA